MANTKSINFIRTRITELCIQKNVSEHRMSLDLDKSGSYIRGITSGTALPSLKELRTLSDEDLEKVQIFLSWIK